MALELILRHRIQVGDHTRNWAGFVAFTTPYYEMTTIIIYSA